MKIIKTYITNSNGTMKTAWNVVAEDGFVIETFDLKRDAKAWMQSAK